MFEKKSSVIAKIYTICGLILLSPSFAHAACVLPPGQEGEIIYNSDFNVPQVCVGSHWVALGTLNPSAGGGGCSNPTGVEGEAVYNAEAHVPQYCDGDDWRTMIGQVSACNAPPDCPNPGDTCNDGSIFGGLVMDADLSCRVVYAADVDQSASIQWSTETVDNSANVSNVYNGAPNQAWLVANENIAQYPAFEACETLVRHSHDDWYLPAYQEANQLGLNGILGGNDYWVSLENGADWVFRVSDGEFTGYNTKSDTYRVRCIRSVESPGVASSSSSSTSCDAVAQWKFDDGSGGSATDSAGGHTGTLYGSPTWQPTGGQFGGALQFDGSDDYVDVAVTPALDFQGMALTIMAWVNVDSTGSGFRTIAVLPQDETASEYAYGLGVDPSDNLFGNFYNQWPSDWGGDAPLPSANTWHHIALVYGADFSFLNFFVNGSIVDDWGNAELNTALIGNVVGNFQIGRLGPTAGQYFKGSIDDVRVYDRIVSSDELADIIAGTDPCSN